MIASVKPRSSMTSASSVYMDANALVVDARDPLPPEIRKMAGEDDPGDNAEQGEPDEARRRHRDGLVERDRVRTELAKHVSLRCAAKRLVSVCRSEGRVRR